MNAPKIPQIFHSENTVDLSRRAFILGAASAGVGAILTGCTPIIRTGVPERMYRDERDFAPFLQQYGYDIQGITAIRQKFLSSLSSLDQTRPIEVVYHDREMIIPDLPKKEMQIPRVIQRFVPAVSLEGKTRSFKNITGISIGEITPQTLPAIAKTLSTASAHAHSTEHLETLLSHWQARTEAFGNNAQDRLADNYRRWISGLRNEAQYAEIMWRILLHTSGIEGAHLELAAGRNLKNSTLLELYNSFAVYGNIMCRFGRGETADVPWPMERLLYEVKFENAPSQTVVYYFIHVNALSSGFGAQYPAIVAYLRREYGRAISETLPITSIGAFA